MNCVNANILLFRYGGKKHVFSGYFKIQVKFCDDDENSIKFKSIDVKVTIVDLRFYLFSIE